MLLFYFTNVSTVLNFVHLVVRKKPDVFCKVHSTVLNSIKTKTKTKKKRCSFWLTYPFCFAAPRTFPRMRSGVWSSARLYSRFGAACLLKHPILRPRPRHRGLLAPRGRTTPIEETGTTRSLVLHQFAPPKKTPSIYHPTLPQPVLYVWFHLDTTDEISILSDNWIKLPHTPSPPTSVH